METLVPGPTAREWKGTSRDLLVPVGGSNWN
jgi:hypothetical protein